MYKADVMKWQVGDGLLYRGAGSFYPGNHGAAAEVPNCAAVTKLINSISGTTPLVNELLPKVLKVSSDPKKQQHKKQTK